MRGLYFSVEGEVAIASDISLAKVRASSPHFAAWLARLETLDQEVFPAE